MQNSDKASLSIILAGRAFFVKMLITLERCGIFGSFFFYLCILTFFSHWYAKHLAGRTLLMKMIITLEPRGIFGSHFVYLCILKLSSR